MTDVDVEVERAEVAAGDVGVCAKLSAESWELNIWARAADYAQLGNIRDASWDDRSSLKVGTSAGADVFWVSDERGVSILVGQDDETWDFAVTVPEHIVQRLHQQVLALG
ncbi:MAG: hypothetical protein ACTHMS_24120 [Jatrophihabitans sp.]|uniref:hypothetical protein n=1 Tax=Jatrophihabitans sp. TaxID=1932789 RepID=UPI003F80DA4F